MSTPPVLQTPLHRVRGQKHGPITRLISPGDVGALLKPFIFLDFFDAEIEPGFGFGMHPHSGIATLTWQPGTDVQYEDTTGQKGVLKAGGLEWMNAGGGAWHQAKLLGRGRATGFQLWVPMPPDVESGASAGQYVAPDAVPVVAFPGGTVRVLLGEFVDAQGVSVCSPVVSHQAMNYLVFSLAQGATFRYTPPASHDVAFAFGFAGDAQIQGHSGPRELLVLDGQGDIELAAPNGPVQVLVGTAKRHDHPLVMGPSSVHTHADALAQGLQRIREIGVQLQREGRL